MRLGELLLQKGAITPDQLQLALNEQRRFGLRLGTNLFQLGYLEIDTVGLALADQHRLTPVLCQHVTALDRKVLSIFSPKVVATYKALPIGFTQTKPPRVIVACVDPATIPREELAFAAGSRIEVWVAPEALFQECMEKYFGAPPMPDRYVALRKFNAAQRQPTGAQAEAARVAKAAAEAAAAAALAPPAPKPAAQDKAAAARRVSRVLSPPPPPPTPKAAPVRLEAPARPVLDPPPPSYREPPPSARVAPPPPPPPPPEPPPEAPSRRRVTPPQAQLEPPPAVRFEPPPPPAFEPPPPPLTFEPPPTPAFEPPIVAQFEAPVVRPSSITYADAEAPAEDEWDVPEAPPEVGPVTAPPGALRPVLDLAQASTLLEMATGKEQIGRVLEDWLRSTFGCGLVLMVKSDMAMGWKGFFPDAEDLVEAVAIPLGKPTMFGLAYGSRAPFRGAPPAEGAQLQERLWKLLRCAPPEEVLVCPVVLGKRVVNLLYAHMDDGSRLTDAVVEEAGKLCADATAAYARLIDKDRKKR